MLSLIRLEINSGGKKVIKAKQLCWHVSKPIQINKKKVHLEMKTKLLYSRGMRLSNNILAK